MSTELFQDEKDSSIYVVRFYGGEERGVCFQIGGHKYDGPDSAPYVQLTQEQAKQVAQAILDGVMGASHDR